MAAHTVTSRGRGRPPRVSFASRVAARCGRHWDIAALAASGRACILARVRAIVFLLCATACGQTVEPSAAPAEAPGPTREPAVEAAPDAFHTTAELRAADEQRVLGLWLSVHDEAPDRALRFEGDSMEGAEATGVAIGRSLAMEAGRAIGLAGDDRPARAHRIERAHLAGASELLLFTGGRLTEILPASRCPSAEPCGAIETPDAELVVVLPAGTCAPHDIAPGATIALSP